MSAAKHTPGPWVVDADGQVWRYELRIADTAPRGADIAPRSERPANARLIAAAPDLLAALQALMMWSDHEALTGLPCGAPVAPEAPSFDATVKMVHAAIAKARGE